jgi:hypothetical protein
MVLLEMTNQFAERIYEASLLLGLGLSALFYVKYKRYTLQMEHDEMIDQFLK